MAEMTEEEAKIFYDELKTYYGDKLVDFEIFPKIFQYQAKLYRYYKGFKNENSNSDGPRN